MLVCQKWRKGRQLDDLDGLPPGALHEVARATTVARMMYAAPAWWGLTTAADRARIESLLARVRRAGYLRDDLPTAADMVRQADGCRLAAVIWSDNHVLRIASFRLS